MSTVHTVTCRCSGLSSVPVRRWCGHASCCDECHFKITLTRKRDFTAASMSCPCLSFLSLVSSFFPSSWYKKWRRFRVLWLCLRLSLSLLIATIRVIACGYDDLNTLPAHCWCQKAWNWDASLCALNRVTFALLSSHALNAWLLRGTLHVLSSLTSLGSSVLCQCDDHFQRISFFVRVCVFGYEKPILIALFTILPIRLCVHLRRGGSQRYGLIQNFVIFPCVCCSIRGSKLDDFIFRSRDLSLCDFPNRRIQTSYLTLSKNPGSSFGMRRTSTKCPSSMVGPLTHALLKSGFCPDMNTLMHVCDHSKDMRIHKGKV